ncbi:hypothetical protein DFH07DRAFT_736500, partial [Mycena maculata]
SVLRNQSVVDEAEKLLNRFKPVTCDVDAHVKAIEAFGAKAVVGVPRDYLLGRGLISGRRSAIEEKIQSYDSGDAHPRLVQVTEAMTRKGKFTVSGAFPVLAMVSVL